MASDILQNKIRSHSYYIVVNIWHLLTSTLTTFFFSHCGPNHPTWHTHFAEPHSLKTLTVCPFPLPQVHSKTSKDLGIQEQP